MARTRGEEPLGPHLPEPIVDRADGTDPEHEAVLADSVGLALLVVLETLAPPERLAFVLHDTFGVIRADREIPPGAPRHLRGAEAVAARAVDFSGPVRSARPALVNGAAGAVLAPGRRPFAVMGFTVRDGRIAAIDVVADPERVSRLELSGIDGAGSGSG